jgi:hypothetical protein
MATPLPDECPVPSPPGSERQHGAPVQTPKCLLSLLTVMVSMNYCFVFSIHSLFLSSQHLYEGTLPHLTHWHILSTAPLQGAPTCDDSFEKLSLILGTGAIRCSAIERQSWGGQVTSGRS